MKLIITIIIASLVLVGCVGEKELDDDYYVSPTICPDCKVKITSKTWTYWLEQITMNTEIQNQRWEMLKEHLGIVEWTEKFNVHSTSTIKGIIINDKETYLTFDPLKVEWVELGCDKYNKIGWDYDCSKPKECHDEYKRCQELKEIL